MSFYEKKTDPKYSINHYRNRLAYIQKRRDSAEAAFFANPNEETSRALNILEAKVEFLTNMTSEYRDSAKQSRCERSYTLNPNIPKTHA